VDLIVLDEHDSRAHRSYNRRFIKQETKNTILNVFSFKIWFINQNTMQRDIIIARLSLIAYTNIVCLDRQSSDNTRNTFMSLVCTSTKRMPSMLLMRGG